MADRKKVLENCKLMNITLTDFNAMDKKILELTDELRFVSKMSDALIRQHVTQAESKEEYDKHRAELVDRYNKAQTELTQIKEKRQSRINQQKKIQRFMDMLKKQPLVQPEWDEHLFSRITESLTVHSNKKAEVCFISGVHITVDIP